MCFNFVLLAKRSVFVFAIFIFSVFQQAFAQSKKGEGVLIDRIVAIVGGNPILQSDVENEYNQMVLQGANAVSLSKCSVLEEMMFNKLLVHQSELDSVEISDAQIQGELDQRMHYYIQQIGSEQKLEEYMGKSIAELKEEYRGDIKKMLLARNVQQKIISDVKVTPGDVRSYFNTIPKDSLPRINAEYEIQQIVKRPPVGEKEKQAVKEKIEKIRERIKNGEDFGALAVLYSEDVESAKRSGELGLVARTDLVSEFSAAAFSLKGKEISQVIETQFGYHVIQLIERRGEMINVRHILLIPKVSTAEILKSQQQLDSVYTKISEGKMTFEEAAEKYSDDENGKTSGGLMINPQSGTSNFEVEELDPNSFFVIDKLKVGDVSTPTKLPTQDGKQVYKLLKLKSRSTPHVANLREDYQRISNIALQIKQNKSINDWIIKKRKNVYVKIDEEFATCQFKHVWVDAKN
jgi:peptidyl-prolyl cis-trans isomerase SurA